MKSLLTMLIFLLLSITSYSHLREFNLQVVAWVGSEEIPREMDVFLYKNYGYYAELFRQGKSFDYWRWTQPNANVVCDINDANTPNPTWEPIAKKEKWFLKSITVWGRK